jgi:caffeoyl-CoA O-methyltransferase
MTKKLFGGTETKIVQYLDQTFHPEDSLLKEVREKAEQNGLPPIQVGKMDGLHLEVLTRAFQAKKAVEIGTLGGYSGICIARGMGPHGKLFTFELEEKHAAIARENFLKAGIQDQVQTFVGPALDNLNQITHQGPFDLVFIDADKAGYPQYLNWAYDHLRIGGVVLADNTFAWGMIADDRFDNREDEIAVKALRQFNEVVAKSGKFRSTLLPTGEGLTFAVKIR